MKSYALSMKIRTEGDLSILEGVSVSDMKGKQETFSNIEGLLDFINSKTEKKFEFYLVNMRVQIFSLLDYIIKQGAIQFIPEAMYYFKNCEHLGKVAAETTDTFKTRVYFEDEGLMKNGKVLQDFMYYKPLIGEYGQWFMLTLYIGVKGQNLKEIYFKDISKILNIEELNTIEHDFLGKDNLTDIDITLESIKKIQEMNITSLTASSAALEEFKNSLQDLEPKLKPKEIFNLLFPQLPNEQTEYFYRAYKGGLCYLNPIYKGVTIGGVGDKMQGLVLDFNSLYDSVMKKYPMPYKEPKYYNDENAFKKDKPDLYIERFICTFKLKKNAVPFVSLKVEDLNQGFNKDQEVELPQDKVLTRSDVAVELTMTNVDKELLYKYYDVDDYYFVDAYGFEACTDVFNKYIDKWYEVKKTAREEGNKGLVQMSKLFLNGLSGKFGTKLKARNKIVYMNNEGIINYEICPERLNSTVYMPMAAFITAYGRKELLTAISEIKERMSAKYDIEDCFIGSDTDSIHFVCVEEDIEDTFKDLIDPLKMGKLKIEAKIYKGLYIRLKTYIIDTKNGMKVACSGLPKEQQDKVNFDNLYSGAVFDKEVYTPGIGGMVKKTTKFIIKEEY